MGKWHFGHFTLKFEKDTLLGGEHGSIWVGLGYFFGPNRTQRFFENLNPNRTIQHQKPFNRFYIRFGSVRFELTVLTLQFGLYQN